MLRVRLFGAALSGKIALQDTDDQSNTATTHADASAEEKGMTGATSYDSTMQTLR
jgi:hypothetical protein